MAKENQNSNTPKSQINIINKGYQPIKEGYQPDIPTNNGYQPGRLNKP